MSKSRKMESHPALPPDLLAALALLSQPGDVALLLQDLLTPGEIEALAERWEIVRRLQEGYSQREISAALGASVTTVSRGNRQLKYGVGGFQLAFERLRRK